MKTLLLLLATTLLTNASEMGKVRRTIQDAYAKDPAGLNDIAVRFNKIAQAVVAGSGLIPLHPNKEYNKLVAMVDDPFTEEVKLVEVPLNDLKPIWIMSAASKWAKIKPVKLVNPLDKTDDNMPIILTPPNATR